MTLRLLFGWVWSVVSCSNQIEEFFDEQLKTGKNQLILFNFLHWDNHHVKVGFKTTTLGWVWPGAPLGQSDFRILWLSISLKWINWYLCLTIVNLFYLFFSWYFLSNSGWYVLPFSYDLLLLLNVFVAPEIQFLWSRFQNNTID